MVLDDHVLYIPIDLGSNFGCATSLEDWASDLSFEK